MLTLAEDVPTRLYRIEILLKAAQALVGLCRYNAPTGVAKDPVNRPGAQGSPTAIVHCAQVPKRYEPAVEKFREMRRHREENAPSQAHLGHVYRALSTHMETRSPTARGRRVEANRNAAIENCTVAVDSFRCFSRALELDPGSYFSGINAILLLAIMDDLFGKTRPAEFGSRSVDELIPIVQFSAESARRRAQETGMPIINSGQPPVSRLWRCCKKIARRKSMNTLPPPAHFLKQPCSKWKPCGTGSDCSGNSISKPLWSIPRFVT